MDEAIGEGRFYDEKFTLRLKARISQERYHRASEGNEIVPLQEKIGTRTYVLARPYILEPDYSIRANIYPQSSEQGQIGEITASDWVGMRQQEIGQAQAWYYPQERIIVLWECFLNDQYQAEDPRTDQMLNSLWNGFENFLLHHFQQAEQIVTPSWEPMYDHKIDAWPEFLQMLGYQQKGKQVFGKDIKNSGWLSELE